MHLVMGGQHPPLRHLATSVRSRLLCMLWGISAPCFAAGGTLGVLCLGDSPCPTLVQRSSNPRPSIYIANPKAENTSIPRERHSHSFPSASSEDARSAPCQQKVRGCRAGRGRPCCAGRQWRRLRARLPLAAAQPAAPSPRQRSASGAGPPRTRKRAAVGVGARRAGPGAGCEAPPPPCPLLARSQRPRRRSSSGRSGRIRRSRRCGRA